MSDFVLQSVTPSIVNINFWLDFRFNNEIVSLKKLGQLKTTISQLQLLADVGGTNKNKTKEKFIKNIIEIIHLRNPKKCYIFPMKTNDMI